MSNLTKAIASETLERLRKELASKMPNNPAIAGWASYAQCDEDGIIRECLLRLSKTTQPSKTFVEIGCGNGLENNTHQLVLDGYSGIWIDGDTAKIESIGRALGGTKFPKLLVTEAIVKTDNAEEIALNASGFLDADSIDFFSLDIDGNDLHVCKPFLDRLSPKLVCVEYNAKYPPPTSLIMQYNAEHIWGGSDYFGASLQAWIDFFKAAGYVLVCCNLSGANAFFVKNDLIGDAFTRYSEDLLFQPPRYHLASFQGGHEASLSWLKQNLTPIDDSESTDDLRNRNTQLITHTPNGSMLVYAGDTIIGQSLQSTGAFQEAKINETVLFLQQQMNFDPEIFVDIGANIGTHCIYALQTGICRNAVAFEPDPNNFKLLKRNIALNGLTKKIDAFPLALSNVESRLELELSALNYGDHRIRPIGEAKVSFGEETERETLEIQATTLDEFCKNCSFDWKKAFVWIDTQGHEGFIFEGGKKFFKEENSPNFLVTEFWPYGIERSGSKRQFFEFLTSCHSIYDINRNVWENHGLVTVDDLAVTYDKMLAETKKEYHPHTDLLLRIK